MALNARMSQNDPRLYSPNRDVAHNFEAVIQEVAKAVETDRWDTLTQLANDHNITGEQLGLCLQALCKFVIVQADHPKESMAACLSRCGFLDLPPIARVVVMAYLGTVTLGIHWAGVREATLDGQGPALTYKGLRATGYAASKLMKLPRWRRLLYRVRGRMRRAWRAITEANKYDG